MFDKQFDIDNSSSCIKQHHDKTKQDNLLYQEKTQQVLKIEANKHNKNQNIINANLNNNTKIFNIILIVCCIVYVSAIIYMINEVIIIIRQVY